MNNMKSTIIKNTFTCLYSIIKRVHEHLSQETETLLKAKQKYFMLTYHRSSQCYFIV
jgi:hypothetical protein